MAVTPTPIYIQAIKEVQVQVATANTARDGTGTLGTLISAGGANGSIVFSIRVRATVTTTAGMVRIFISLDGGTTKRMFDEIPIDAVTVGANTPAFNDVKNYDKLDFFLPDTSALVYASTHNAEAINVFAAYGNL